MSDNPTVLNNLNIVRILNKIKPHVVVSRYPRKKSSIIKFNLPTHIEGKPIKRFMSMTFGITAIDQEFILDNLMYCRHIQPDKNSITIVGGNDPDKKPAVIKTTEYGTFHIFGRKVSTVTDPKDLNSSIDTYICKYGITAHVHIYKFRGKYITNVYYGSTYDETLSYLKLMSSETLYERFVEYNIEQLSNCEPIN